MNSFDAAVSVGLVFAVVTGFNTGLVRSAVTILAYLFAAPLAMAVMSALAPPGFVICAIRRANTRRRSSSSMSSTRSAGPAAPLSPAGTTKRTRP